MTTDLIISHITEIGYYVVKTSNGYLIFDNPTSGVSFKVCPTLELLIEFRNNNATPLHQALTHKF